MMALMFAAGTTRPEKPLCENPADDRVVRALGTIYLNCATSRAKVHAQSGSPAPAVAAAAIEACGADRESLVAAFQECRIRDGDPPALAARIVSSAMVSADAWVKRKTLEAVGAKGRRKSKK